MFLLLVKLYICFMSIQLTKLYPKTWVDKYSDYLFNYTISRVNDCDLAKDLVSETFLAGLKSKDKFKGNASEKTWLVAILKHKIIDHYRKKNSTKGKAEVRMNFVGDDNEGDWLAERGEDLDKNADQLLENSELGEAIYNCLGLLPPQYAAVFIMKNVHEHDNEVICKELGITTSNLWVSIHRAKKQLAECLGTTWF